nr:MAG TPA: hypothetical protein [Caudoviricetes sp.]
MIKQGLCILQSPCLIFWTISESNVILTLSFSGFIQSYHPFWLV